MTVMLMMVYMAVIVSSGDIDGGCGAADSYGVCVVVIIRRGFGDCSCDGVSSSDCGEGVPSDYNHY